MVSPCRKDCPGRSAECHTSCEKYKAYEEWRFAKYDQRDKEKEATPYMSEVGKRWAKINLLSNKHGIRRK